MKKASRLAKKLILSEKDFKESLGDKKIKKFVDMLSNNLYSFRVKEALFKDGKVSARGFFMNDNIYNLPLGKKNSSGEIMIDNSLLDIFKRYLLAEEMTLKGDALTAFMVDHDDGLYKIIEANGSEADKIEEQEYIQIFSRAYNTTSDIILEAKINNTISDSPELMELMETLNAENAAKDKKAEEVTLKTVK